MDSKRQFTVMYGNLLLCKWLFAHSQAKKESYYNWTGPGCSVARVSLRGTRGHGFDPGPRHAKVVKIVLDRLAQTYGVELWLIDPVSGSGC